MHVHVNLQYNNWSPPDPSVQPQMLWSAAAEPAASSDEELDQISDHPLEMGVSEAGALESVMELSRLLGERVLFGEELFQQAKDTISRLRRRAALAEGTALDQVEGEDLDDYGNEYEPAGLDD